MCDSSRPDREDIGRPRWEDAKDEGDAAWWGAVILSVLTAGFLPAAAGASELIGRNATGVRLQADASVLLC